MDNENNRAFEHLRDTAIATFRLQVANRIRSGGELSEEGFYDLAVDAAESTAPRRDSVLLAVLCSTPSAMRQPLVDGAHTIADATHAVLIDMLRDHIIARMGGMRSVGRAAQDQHGGDPRDRSEARLFAAPLVWEVFLARLENWFMTCMAHDAALDALPAIDGARAPAAAYLERHVELALPRTNEAVLELIGSANELWGARTPAAPTFGDAATGLLETSITERLVDWYKEFSTQRKPVPLGSALA